MAKGEGKVVAQNKKAHHDYTIVDTLEAGMVLTGTEIKSVRAARINLKDGFAQVKKWGSLAEQCSYRPLRRGQYLEPGT
ncbi:tmRNA-binding protein SmpB [Streptococcus oralis]|nr:tmRNA-binding protein SmpB [Streptococcus oralis]